MKRIAVSTSINFVTQVVGSVAPAALMLFTFPAVKAQLSARSFATFAFLFTTTSFMSVLDAGLGRSVTYFAARYLHAGRQRDAIRSLWAAIAIGFVLSVLAAGAISLAYLFYPPQSAWSSASAIDYSAVLMLLWFLPAFVCGSLLRGFLEAEQRFFASNGVQALYGVVLALAPLVLVRFASSIDTYPIVFGCARVAAVGAYVLMIARTQRRWLAPDREVGARLGEVLRYARWLFASNLIGIAIVYADRIAVATHFSSELVSAYVVPMEFALRGQVLIGSLSTVLFPVLVRISAGRSADLVSGTIGVQAILFGAILLGAVSLSAFVPSILGQWMGHTFSADATFTLRTALVGLAPIGCASLAMAVLNSQGRTAQPAALHMIELPLYLLGLWAATRSGRLAFVVAVWLARVCFDMAGTQYFMLAGHPQRRVLWSLQQGCVLALLGAYFFLSMESPGSGAGGSVALGLLAILMALAGARAAHRSVVHS